MTELFWNEVKLQYCTFSTVSHYITGYTQCEAKTIKLNKTKYNQEDN